MLTAFGFGAGSVVAAPITFNTALPVAKGEFVNRELLVLSRSGDDPGGAERDVDVKALISVLGYGISGDLAIFGVLPYVDKELQATLGNGTPGFLYGVLEANMIYRDQNRNFASRDGNSGGTSFFISPGLQYVTKRYIIEGSVQLPVSQNLNGNALENDHVTRVGFRWNLTSQMEASVKQIKIEVISSVGCNRCGHVVDTLQEITRKLGRENIAWRAVN